MATDDDSIPEDDPILLRAVEVARLLGLSRSKVYQMMSTGQLRVIRIDRAVRVPRHALRVWIDHHTDVPASRDAEGAA